jgi:hypothetical protein
VHVYVHVYVYGGWRAGALFGPHRACTGRAVRALLMLSRPTVHVNVNVHVQRTRLFEP